MKIAKYIGLWILMQVPMLAALVYFQIEPALCTLIGMVYGFAVTTWLSVKYVGVE